MRAVAPVDVMLLGPPRVERDGAAVAFDTRKAVALLAVLALADRPRPRDVLAELLWPEHDAEHARGRAAADAVGAALRGRRRLRGRDARQRLARAQRRAARRRRPVPGRRGRGPGRRRRRRVPGRLPRGLRAARRARVRGLAARRGRRAAARAGAGAGAAGGGVGRPGGGAPLARARPAARAGAPRADPALRGAGRPRRGARPVPRVRAHAVARAGGAAAGGDDAAVRGDQRGHAGGARRPAGGRGRRAPARAAGRAGARVGGACSAPTTASPPTGASCCSRARRGSARRGWPRSWWRRCGRAAPRCWAVAPTRRRRRSPTARWSRRCAGGCARTTRGWRRWASARSARRRGSLGDLSASPPPPLDGPAAQARFLDGVWETLAAAAAGPVPGVLVIDDVQWADEATLGLLTYGARRLAGRRMLVLLTSREPLRRVGGSAIELARLGEDEVGELLEAAGGPEALAHRLYEETEGLPFLLVEYLNSLGADPDWTLPAGARELLLARLEPVSETARQVLAAAAVIGRSFDVDTVRAASGRGDEETVTALEELVRRGLVREGRYDYDFAHEQLRRLVADETGLARRRLLHGRVADALGGPDAEVARHLRLAGRDAEAAAAYRRAAEHARALFANAEALEHLRAALAVGDPEPASLHAAIGDLQTLQGEYGAALASYETAAAHAAPDGVGAIEHRLGQVRHRRGEWALATAHFEAALAAETEPARRGADPGRPVAERARRRRPGARGGARRARPRAGRGGRRPARARPGPQPARRARHQRRRGGRRARAPRPQPRARGGDRRPGRARRRAQQPRARPPRARRARAGAGADPRGARAVRRAGRPPPRGGAAQQPRRPPARRRAPRGRDGGAQVRGGDLRGGRRGG